MFGIETPKDEGGIYAAMSKVDSTVSKLGEREREIHSSHTEHAYIHTHTHTHTNSHLTHEHTYIHIHARTYRHIVSHYGKIK